MTCCHNSVSYCSIEKQLAENAGIMHQPIKAPKFFFDAGRQGCVGIAVSRCEVHHGNGRSRDTVDLASISS